MSEIRITIKNADEIKRAFHEAPAKATQNIQRAIARIIYKVENSAKKLAPVNKGFGGGNLRQSIRSETRGIVGGAVVVGAPYAIYVHEGTKPHVIQIVNKKVLANKRTGQIFGTRVNHPGTKAQPFLQQAVDENSQFIEDEFTNAVKTIL